MATMHGYSYVYQIYIPILLAKQFTAISSNLPISHMYIWNNLSELSLHHHLLVSVYNNRN